MMARSTRWCCDVTGHLAMSSPNTCRSTRATGNQQRATSSTVFLKWMMINPSPIWIISDSGVQYTAQEFQDFCMSSGIGLLTAPAEAHWLMSAEEGAIRILKNAVARLLREEPSLTVANAFALAAHGSNHTIGPSGYSAFQ